MTQTVSVPGVGDLEFPDGMSQQDMAAAIQKNFPQLHRPDESKLQKIGKDIARQFGLTARYAVEGITALPNMIGDVLGLNSSQAVSGGLTKLGLPEPQGAEERVVGDVSRGMAGAVPFVAGGNMAAASARPVLSRIGSFLSEAPATQVVSGGAGGGASGAAREMGAGPVGQTVAGIAGGMAVPVGMAAAASAVRGGIRGGEASRAAGAQRIEQFKEAGTTPSAAQAFQTHQAQGTEAFLSRDPGSHGLMIDFAERQASDISKKVDDVAGILAGKTSPMVAGRAVEQGIKGEGGFLDKFKATQKTLYDNLDSYIPADTRVDISKTKRVLESLNADIPGAPNLSRWFKNARIKGIDQALRQDTEGTQSVYSLLPAWEKQRLDSLPPAQKVAELQSIADGKMPYEAVKKLRTLVGNELEDANITSSVPRSKWKALYAALSDDLGNTAKSKGEAATKAFQRANAYTKAGYQRIDDILQPLLNKGDPEKIFRAALTGSKEGDSMIHGVMQSLPETQKKVLAATILKKLGKAPPSAQGAEGDTFMVSTYLRNWNLLSPEAKRSLFSRWGPKFVQDLDTVAKTAEDIQKGGQVYANPSGTGVALTLQHTVGGAVLLAITGNLKLAGAVATESLTANATARLMTNPRFVNWLAQSTKMPAEALPIALNTLSQQANKYNDDELKNFVKSMQDRLPK